MKKQHAASTKQGGSAPVQQRWVGFFLLALVVVMTVLVVDRSRRLGQRTMVPQAHGSNSLSAVAVEASSFKKLEGRWLRPDGGYVLEIKRAAEDGHLEAAYYNPQPIQVSRARASRMGSYVKVEVELRDVGYPGCLYTLLLEPGRENVLRGTYYQAALGETYDIQFERCKE
ncbi:hypothetical protein NXS98_07845 [Fontisphaera persica]|uniref:hypothetical protein n=1 Tax=Fontisphaera persica TaxID=2974023 RepID=UPI0024BF27E4|nr:hypothetical protein [Fontisphaera persica]WCJ61020.1 hypothetical protein NXS98_07845 [Fontisphaera persica]